MKDQIRSEFRKVRTTRTVWGLLLGLVVLTGAATLGSLASRGVSALNAGLFAVLPVIGILYAVTAFVVVLAVRSYTDEFRHGSIVPTLLADPVRRRVLAAKVIVMAGCSVVFTLVAFASGAGLASVWLLVKGATVAVAWGPMFVIAAKAVLAGILWAALGVGVGVAIQHQVAAIVSSFLWLLMVEGLIGNFAPSVAKFLPQHAADAMAGIAAGNALLVAPMLGGLLLLGWAVLSTGLGAVLLERRDIA